MAWCLYEFVTNENIQKNAIRCDLGKMLFLKLTIPLLLYILIILIKKETF